MKIFNTSVNKRFLIVILIVTLFLMQLVPFVSVVNAKDMSSVTIDNMKVLLYIMGDAISQFEPSLTITTTFFPSYSDMDIDKLIEYARKYDPFTGHLLYLVKWTATPKGNEYEVEFEFSYYITEQQYSDIQEFADDFVKSIQSMSDYDKVKYTHDYLIKNCTYDINKDGPYNCLFEKRSNCNGYALSFYMIMKKCGIPCRYITGKDHAWNAVKLGVFWYNIDVTWDDSDDKLTYDFFLIGRGDWEGHDRNTATAGHRYNDYNQLSNWTGTIYYWCRVPLLFAIIISTYCIIKRRK